MYGRTRPTPGSVVEIPIASIRPSPYQMRRVFAQGPLNDLAASIQENGLLQPVTVRDIGSGQFQLIAGERRLRACRLAGQATIRAQILSANDTKAALLCMVENLQREELHFFEEAEGYASLVHVHGMTQEQVAERLGMKQSTVANKLRLLRLPPAVREVIMRADLTERHARALLRLPNEREQLRIAMEASDKGLTVKATELLVEEFLHPPQEEDLSPEDAASPQEGGKVLSVERMRRAYGDWRLLSNTVLSAVEKMRTAGVPVVYHMDDLGDQIELRVTLPKTEARREARRKGAGA